jgi:multicomponent Na+:H+ antiporter subunit E
MKHMIWLGCVLFGTWLLWSGHYELLIEGFGVLSCVFVVLLDARLERFAGVKHDAQFGLRWISYGPWLVWGIIKANFDVARIILSPDLPINPQLIVVNATQRSELGKVAYANSITLTPGTVTLDVREDTMLVHALTDASAAGVMTGIMDRRVTAMERIRS